MQRVLVLVGATASGKTDLLLSVFGGGGPLEGRAEVVSADAMQAYRGMDIGTAKPGAGARTFLPHHLLDIVEPSEQFTAGDFVRLALAAIEDIRSRGRLPIVSGGAGFYVRNLILGLPSAPKADPGLREAVAADLERLGPEALRRELAAGDPESAARIHSNDLYRLTRALEILRGTGRPLAGFRAGEGSRAGDFLLVEFRRPREELAGRIEARVDAMFEAGLAAEVAALRSAGYGREAPGMKAIGYSEFLELEAEGLRGPDLEAAARARIKADSLRYAKRQLTFFRGLARDVPGSLLLEAGEGAAAALAGLASGRAGEGL